MPVNNLVPALMIVIALAACRGDDPDNAPPIGHADADAGSATSDAVADSGPGRAAATEPALDRVVAAPVPTRAALAADARRRLDRAWAACGDGLGDAATRCRDEAMLDYVAAIQAARAGGPIDDAAAIPPGVLDRHDAVAVVQTTGTRG
jgi:hypothetical protein